MVQTRDFDQGWRVKINLVVRDGWQCEAHSTSIYLCCDCSVWPWCPPHRGRGTETEIESFQVDLPPVIPTCRVSSGQGNSACYDDGGKQKIQRGCTVIADVHLNDTSSGLHNFFSHPGLIKQSLYFPSICQPIQPFQFIITLLLSCSMVQPHRHALVFTFLLPFIWEGHEISTVTMGNRKY